MDINYYLREEVDLEEDSIYAQEVDYSKVPKWKQVMSLGILILTVIAMIFEQQIGIALHVSAWIGALVLMATRVIPEKKAMRSIDMNTILLFVGSLALANAIQVSGAGKLIASSLMSTLGKDHLRMYYYLLYSCYLLR